MAKMKVILLKYDIDEKASKPSGAAMLEHSNKDKELGEIRQALVKQKALDKHAKSPFCTKDGAEVNDELTFVDYLAFNNVHDSVEDSAQDDATPEKPEDGASEGERAKRAKRTKRTRRSRSRLPNSEIYSLYCVNQPGITERETRGPNANIKEFLGKALDLQMQDKSTFLEAVAPKLQSAFQYSDWKASTSSNPATYPYDMDEKDWDAVMSNNNLLYGIKPVEDENGVKQLEPAHFPAFAIKPRAIHHFMRDSSSAEKVSTNQNAKFRIPRFYIVDASNVDVLETQNSLQASMATSAFNQTTIEASASGSIMGVDIAVKAGYSKQSNTAAASSGFNENKHMYISYNFPRVGIPLDPDFLELSDECKADLTTLKGNRTVQRLDWFYDRYGTIFNSEIQLGGRLYSFQDSSSFGSATVSQKSERVCRERLDLRLERAAQCKLQPRRAEQLQDNGEFKQSQTIAHLPARLVPDSRTLSELENHKGTGSETFHKLDEDILPIVSKISNMVVQFQLQDHFSSKDKTYECAMGMLFRGSPKLGVENYYSPSCIRYPILNYPNGSAELTGVYKTFQAVANNKNLWVQDGIPRVNTVTSFPTPKPHHHARDHYTDDGILYAGRNKPPNVKVSFLPATLDYTNRHIGSGAKVTLLLFDGEGNTLGNLSDHEHSIRILGRHDGKSLQSVDITGVQLDRQVWMFVDGVAGQPPVEYFNDTLEKFDASKLFAAKDDADDNLKHFVFTNI
ncbi:hypothetical protein BDW62DRAFT_199224 [Aspergillus aurantiobrunneus]